jgi:hypothetical protein
MKKDPEHPDLFIDPHLVLHSKAISDIGNSAYIIAYGAVSLSGFLVGMFVGWLIWG